MNIEILLRFIPRHSWVKLYLRIGSKRFEPGHRWMYEGLLRRDAWKFGPIGFGISRLPSATPTEELLRSRVEKSSKR